MSYSFALLAHVNWTRTRWPTQVAGGLVTVRVKTSQLTPSTQEASVFTPPPGALAVPCQVAEGPPGLGPTVPKEGFCARVPTNGITQNKKMPLNKKSVPSVARAIVEEECVFI